VTFDEHDDRACTEYVMSGRVMREVKTGVDKELPPPMNSGTERLLRDIGMAPLLTDLPWMRRERVDSNYRRTIRELEALIAEGDAWAPFYQALLEGAVAGLALINEIEDMVDESLRGPEIRS
jgi:hypothetical protein